MKIAITADPELPVPPKLYGGIERVIDMLARGLVRRGHSVTVLANPASETAGELVPYKGRSSSSSYDTLRNMFQVSRTVLGGNFDVVHSFGRVAYLAPLLPLHIPKLMTYQREVSPRSVAWGHKLSRGSLHFSAISESMMKDVSRIGHWHLIYNGVPMDSYDFAESVPADAPLVFLGRVEHIKGTHLAIAIAQKTRRRLIIAGNVPQGHQAYFDEMIQPHLDGDKITYVGPVDDSQKNKLLGGAAALLMPILWEEPFGIVMAEAMACGTPVLGLRRGSVPEVVSHGITGFVGDYWDELADKVPELPTLDRRQIRQVTKKLFGDEAIVDAYERLYVQLVTAATAKS